MGADASKTKERTGYGVSFPKPRETIQVVDDGLTGSDRKLFNVLLHRSQQALKKDAHQTFATTATNLREGIGWGAHNGNVELANSLERLQKTIIKLDYYGQSGELRQRRLNLLITTDIPANQGLILWKFHPELAELLANPKSPARIHLALATSLRSGYSGKLYENLTIWAEEDSPWRAEPQELRDLLGAHAQSYKNFKVFNDKVLQPAIQELRDHDAELPFTVRVDYERDAKRRIRYVIFDVQKKDDWQPNLETADTDAAGVRVLSDAEVSELRQDGRTLDPTHNAEAPDPEKVDALVARVKTSTIDEIAAAFPAIDANAKVREWAEWMSRTQQTVQRPKMQIFRYLDACYGHLKGLAADKVPEHEMQVSDAYRHVMHIVAEMASSQRRSWAALAQRLEPSVSVPDLSCEHFFKWVPTVAEMVIRDSYTGGCRDAERATAQAELQLYAS